MTLRVIQGGGDNEVADLLESTARRLSEEDLSGLILIAIQDGGIDLSHTTMPRSELYWHLQKVAHYVLSEE